MRKESNPCATSCVAPKRASRALAVRHMMVTPVRSANSAFETVNSALALQPRETQLFG
jgi:hypothetical protein